jgi:hypothetical protein
MRELLFEKKVSYSSSFNAGEIEEKLLHLVKGKAETEHRFAGKVTSSNFSLTPILSATRNFKITLLGEVNTTGNNSTAVTITYTISNTLRVLVYGMFLFYAALALVLNIAGIEITTDGLRHLELYPMGASLIFIVICKIIFINQYYEYSGFITGYLELEEIQ